MLKFKLFQLELQIFKFKFPGSFEWPFKYPFSFLYWVSVCIKCGLLWEPSSPSEMRSEMRNKMQNSCFAILVSVNYLLLTMTWWGQMALISTALLGWSISHLGPVDIRLYDESLLLMTCRSSLNSRNGFMIWLGLSLIRLYCKNNVFIFTILCKKFREH